MVSTSWFVLGLIALALLTAYLLAGILGPMPRYWIKDEKQIPANESPPFLLLLSSLVDAALNRRPAPGALLHSDL